MNCSLDHLVQLANDANGELKYYIGAVPHNHGDQSTNRTAIFDTFSGQEMDPVLVLTEALMYLSNRVERLENYR